MIDFCRKYPVFWLFNVVILILLIGMVATSGWIYVDRLLIVIAAFSLAYFASHRWIGFPKSGYRFRMLEAIGRFKYLNEALFLGCTGIFALDIIAAGGPPALRAGSVTTVKEFTELRGNIHCSSNSLFVYLSAWNIKAFISFALLHYALTKRRLLFYLLLVLAAFYAFAMMQKSFIVSMLAPLTILMLLQRKFIKVGLLATLAAAILVLQTSQLSHLINTDVTYTNKPSEPVTWMSVPKALLKRVFIVPGEMVSKWFEVVPEKKPYLYGDGYKIIAKLKGHKYVEYNEELYPVIRPEYASQGMTGTVNVATFMREYANFGYAGLVLAGCILGFFFVVLERVYRDHRLLFITLNVFPILLLSSTNLLTLLFSGGWIITILMYLVFRQQYEPSKLCAE